MLYFGYIFIILGPDLSLVEFIEKCEFVWKWGPKGGVGRDVVQPRYSSRVHGTTKGHAGRPVQDTMVSFMWQTASAHELMSQEIGMLF